MRIDRDRLLQQAQSSQSALFRCRKEDRKRAKIEIVGGEIRRQPRGGSAHLGRLQSRFDDVGDASGDLVLQIEDVLERAVKPVGPEMRTDFGLD